MAHPLSPTAILPSLATLYACRAIRVKEALRTLQDVYFPNAPSTSMSVSPVFKQSLSNALLASRPKQIVRPPHRDKVYDSGYASAEEDDQDEETRSMSCLNGENIDEEEESLDVLRSDTLERGYTVKWLTGLVKRGDGWICEAASSEEQDTRAMCLDDASRLLTLFAGDDAPEEAVSRTFSFPFHVPSSRGCWDGTSLAFPITVELNDAPVDGSDHTAVGLQSWGSAIIFATRMCSDPERFLGPLHPCIFTPTATADAGPKTATSARVRRALELGAGTGLLSITAAQIFSRFSIQAEIKATDYHPNVLENLARNVWQNPSAECVSVEKLDWCAVASNEDGQRGGVYDVVLAADVVYHPDHASWIRGCVERMLTKDGVFWLIIPKRTIGRHERLGETVEAAFPVMGNANSLVAEHLAIVRREEMEKVDGVGRADEGGYTLFEIRWVY